MRFGVAAVFLAAALSACGTGNMPGSTPAPPLVHSVTATAEAWTPIFSEPGSNVVLNTVQPSCDVADTTCSRGPHKGDVLEVVCLDRTNPYVLGVIAGKYLQRQDAVAYWSNSGDQPMGFINLDQIAGDQQGRFTKSKFAELSGAAEGQTSCENYDNLAHNADKHRSQGHVK
jgi:hypothetical protein